MGSVLHTGVNWELDASYRALSPKLDLNDLGFLPGFNVWGADVDLLYHERKPRGGVQDYSVGTGFTEELTFDNAVMVQNVSLHGDLRFTNLWSLKTNLYYGLPGRHDVFEAGDGGRLKRPQTVSGELYLQTDPRRHTQFYGGVYGFHELGRPGWNTTGTAQLTFNLLPTLQLDVSSQLTVSKHATRLWFPDGCRDATGESCTPLSTVRHYTFGQLASDSLSFTSHAAYTFSTRLSLQGYAQLFMARGAFTHYSHIDTMGTNPVVRPDALVPDPAFHDDSDGDGAKDGDFQRVALNLNLVLRWEYLPGSTLLVVYSRSQSADDALVGHAARLTPGGLNAGPTEDVFLIKLSYFWR